MALQAKAYKRTMEYLSEEAWMQRLWIPEPMPGLNQLIDARRVRFQKGTDSYNVLKKKWARKVQNLAYAQRFPFVEQGKFTYLFLEPNRRRDPSNVIAGGVKFLEDALVEAGLLENDGWKNVLGIATHWCVCKERPGVVLFVGNGLLDEEEAHKEDLSWQQGERR